MLGVRLLIGFLRRGKDASGLLLKHGNELFCVCWLSRELSSIKVLQVLCIR